MLGFLALATWIWDPTPRTPRLFLLFFGADRTVSIAGVNITWHELLALVMAVVIALALRFFFFRTRNGVAMRAVVDDPDLLELNAGPARAAGLASWVGARAAGVLITPSRSAMSARRACYHRPPAVARCSAACARAPHVRRPCAGLLAAT
jgi:branched-subunit amino acid ABC-type transport system permease component